MATSIHLKGKYTSDIALLPLKEMGPIFCSAAEEDTYKTLRWGYLVLLIWAQKLNLLDSMYLSFPSLPGLLIIMVSGGSL